MADPDERPRTIYHVALERDWIDALSAGEYRVSTRGATLDEVGYIHASFAHQVRQVGTAIYGNATDALVVLAINTALLNSPVKVENLEGGTERFPHIHGPLPASAVVDVFPVKVAATEFVAEGLPSRP
jgi:uncharacterized protein (DUF952 family)